MFAEEARLATFSGTAGSSSSSKKKQVKADAGAWPHPTTGRAVKTSGIPLPATLAKYGFYSTPTNECPDTVAHFLYSNAVIANWRSGDDPLTRLDQVVPGNGWCKIFWSVEQATQQSSSADSSQWVWTRSDLLPTSEELVEARRKTFGNLWPYDGKKGWKPTSKKLAEAGFYFTPTEEEEDSATCIYCKKSLGGWEKGDDPTHEHKKRKPDCPFFNCMLAVEPEPAPETKETADVVEEGIRMPKRGTRVVSTARKPSARAKKGHPVPEPEPEPTSTTLDTETMSVNEPEDEEEPKAPPRSMRAASRRATKAIELINSDTDINRIPRKEEVTRPVQHAATDPVSFPSSEPNHTPMSDPISVNAAVTKPKRSRSKNKIIDETIRDPTTQPEAETTVIERQDNQDDQIEDEPEQVEEPKRRGRGRVTKAAPTESSVDATRAPTRTRKVSKKITAASEAETEIETLAVDNSNPIKEISPAPEPQVPRTSTTDTAHVASAKGKKSKTSAKSVSRRSTKIAASEPERVPDEDQEAELLQDASPAVVDESGLATATSQATIRASAEDQDERPARRLSTRTPRAPLAQLAQLDTLQLDDTQRRMTMGLWLQFKADAAAREMRQSGLDQLQDLENQMQAGRLAVERALRGQQS